MKSQGITEVISSSTVVYNWTFCNILTFIWIFYLWDKDFISGLKWHCHPASYLSISPQNVDAKDGNELHPPLCEGAFCVHIICCRLCSILKIAQQPPTTNAAIFGYFPSYGVIINYQRCECLSRTVKLLLTHWQLIYQHQQQFYHISAPPNYSF